MQEKAKSHRSSRNSGYWKRWTCAIFMKCSFLKAWGIKAYWHQKSLPVRATLKYAARLTHCNTASWMHWILKQEYLVSWRWVSLPLLVKSVTASQRSEWQDKCWGYWALKEYVFHARSSLEGSVKSLEDGEVRELPNQRNKIDIRDSVESYCLGTKRE